ncbi:MAG: HU domain-containing protein [Bacteroidia bacterium]
MAVILESVEKQIAQLLESNDCVQVPDFGGFVLNRRSALFGPHSHEILAPGKAITFNRNLQMNDGLLCSHISTAEKIPYIEAQLLLAEKVRSWKNILSAGQVLHLENIGSLQQDASQKWQFSPFSLKNFDLKAYGLTSLQLKPVEQQTYTQKLDKKIQTKTKALPKGRRVWLQRAVYSTIVSVSLVLGFLVLDEIGFQYRNFDSTPIAKTEQVKPEAVKPEVVTPETAQINTYAENNSTPNTPTEIVAPQPETATASYIESKFYVIGGAFSSTANANKFAQQLEKKGYKAEVLDNENGLTRVAYIVEADSLSAEQQLQKIKQEENQAAWILKW